jgi:hypothetical protein
MNCPQCSAANGPDAGFCGSCGARLAVAESAAPSAGYASEAAGAPLGYNAPSGYNAPNTPGGYNAPNDPNAPGGYNPPSYQAPGGYNASGPAQPGGYPQGQYPPPGQYQPPTPQGGWQAPNSRGSGSVPPVNFDLNRATTVDKVVAVATFITMISIWMPWFTVSYLGATGSGSGTAAHGWLWLEFILALVLIAYLVARVAWDTMPISIPVAHAPLLIVGTAVQLLLILIAFFDLPSSGGLSGVSVGWGFGAFLGLLAALVAAGPVLYPAIRSYLDSRKGTGAGTGASY